MANIWDNPELSKDLAAKVAAGTSYRIVAEELSAKYGIIITRNSCMGRADRLGIESPRRSGETDESKLAKITRPKRQPKIKQDTERRSVFRMIRANGNSMSMRVHQTTEFVEPRKLKCVEIEPLHLTLMQLETNSCRYPYGGNNEGDPITFCGHPKMEDHSYCAPHKALCLLPPKPPKERGYVMRHMARIA